MHLQAGALLKNGEYKIEKVLGQGGFGITYLAEQTSLGRKVALKEFFMEGLCNRDAATSHVSVPSVGSKKLVERFKQKFIKEARNIASLEHKHIVPIIDVFEENGTAYYVMKYFSGGSLSFNSAIPEDVALRYTKQLASALRFIHKKRMMHLDIKPSNILLDDEDNVVLIDFGLAKQYDNAGQQTSTTPVGISHGYAPIEQYRSGGVSAFSPATDIYSLGATLYKLLTGTVPPEAMDLVATGLPACPANVSAETWNAVKSAMQPAALSRPQSVDKFLSLLSENGTEGRRPEGLKSKVKTENGKNKEENDGETELNGNVKAASKREGENLFTHTASESSFDEVKGENGKLVADEFHSIDVVEVPDSEDGNVFFRGKPSTARLSVSEESHSASPVISNVGEKSHSADVVISNESEKSQKNKPGKSLWLILLLLLIAVAGAWFLFGGTGSGDASNRDTKIVKKDTLKEVDNAEAQYNLGVSYENGQGVKQSYEEAVKWYILAAEQGYAPAQLNLGYCYELGQGVKQSYEEAVKWYTLAAEQELANAQFNLGVCYKNGQGVKQSYEEAVKWWHKAAEQGDADAQINLGVCYELGQGVKQSYEEAVKWYTLAAEQGDAEAQLNLGICYDDGQGIEQSYKEAAKWYTLAAEQGVALAQYNLGVCYKKGQGVEQSYEKAVKWYRKAAEQGDTFAQHNLGVCYENGQGVEQSYKEAVKWYTLAAEQGLAQAQFNLGVCYGNGQGVKQSYEEAVKWYRKAAEQGDADAQYNLGVCYENGLGVKQSDEEAVKWYTLAADQGDADAQKALKDLGYGNTV